VAITIAGMPLYVWLALLVLLAATVGGIGVIVARGLSLWRTFKAFGRALDATVTGVVASMNRMEARSATLGAELPRLETAAARLRADLARFAVLRQAVQDARDSFAWILAVYPRK
jgi:hypothetical protein